MSPRSSAVRKVLVVVAVAGGVLVLPALPASADAYQGWNVICPFSHKLPDDPIVFPGQPGASHNHDFYGAVTTDSKTKYRNLRNSDTTCSSVFDSSGYWQPTFIMNGQNLVADQMFAYYRPPAGEDYRDVIAPPPGLKIVAGDSKAEGPQPTNMVYFNCSDDANGPKAPKPYDCSPWPGTKTAAHIIFPSCWDGVHKDSTDHKSHMAYPDYSDGCPGSHPVPVARVSMSLRWPVVNGTGGTLSSGSAYTLHGDFFNGWDQNHLMDLVVDCINAGKACGHLHEDGSPRPVPAEAPPQPLAAGPLALPAERWSPASLPALACAA
jgi:hypothetical protein